MKLAQKAVVKLARAVPGTIFEHHLIRIKISQNPRRG